jgi:hypothetical protein
MKAIVVEDRGTFGPALVRQLEPMGVQARWMPHPIAVSLDRATWAAVPLVLIDALDLSSQQDDRTLSRLASLDILESLARMPREQAPRIVVYSTHMAKPEVNIPLRQPGVVHAFYEVGALLEHLPDVVMGRYPGQVALPRPADWAQLHPDLPASADVAAAHQLMRTHDRTWRQVWDGDAAFDKAAQVWVRRNVLSALGTETSGYSLAIEVVRKLAGLPYRWP